MALYSFVVIAPCPLAIPKPFVALDSGVNTFNVEVEDIEVFKTNLEKEGVIITRVYNLDSTHSSDIEPLQLGEFIEHG